MGNKSKEHHKLDEMDSLIMTLVKGAISQGIRELKKRKLRGANIEIELVTHIKKELQD
jgi:hypothetical protein